MKLGFMKNAKKIKKARSSDPSSDTRGESAAYHAPAVDKALDIFELLSEASQGMSLTGIAAALGRTKQEIFRVLVCLQERGYLVRDESQFYRLSTKMFEIGSQHASTQFLVAHAMPHLERLARKLRESCHLNIVVQNRMLVVARAEGDSDVMLAVRIGASFEIHRRLSGLVALATFPEERRQEYWKQSGESASSVKAYETEIATIQRQGFAAGDSPIVMGVKDYATPVMGGGATLLGVLCVSHLCRKDEPAERISIVDAVVECARSISAEFGPTPKEKPSNQKSTTRSTGA
jgi:DNA-binding IclR family transcriptional regulator